jgi:NADPH:quinone reductase-like Zn-dependent oxidoreductase
VGNRSVPDYARALSPAGACVVAGFTTFLHLFQVVALGAWVSRTGGKKVGIMGSAKSNKKDLLVVKDLLETGKVVPVIDRCYPLHETAEAIRYLEQGHARGKVVITVGS